MAELISVQEALDIVLSGVQVLDVESVPILEANGRILAESISAEEDFPPFANSSMDGYAVRSSDVYSASSENPTRLTVVADIPAGSSDPGAIGTGSTARIMTGAPLPEGADSVVPVEHTNENWREQERPIPENIDIFRPARTGDYIRHPGEDIRNGTQVLSVGKQLRPQEIGVLATLGFPTVKVYRKPRIGVLATGSELIKVSEPLSSGKIRNSNGYTQMAQVLRMGAIPVDLGVAKDTIVDVKTKLESGLEQNVDLFVSSAGVSVGAHDVVKKVLDEDGSVNFWRIRMRPGKPLAFGTYQQIPYLGLPGNPVSAMVSFERFVRPAILKMAGHRKLDRPTVQVVMQDEMRSDGRETYLRAIVERDQDGYVARSTGQQGSHIMTSLVKSNALVIVPEGKRFVAKGETLSALMIDWPETVF